MFYDPPKWIRRLAFDLWPIGCQSTFKRRVSRAAISITLTHRSAVYASITLTIWRLIITDDHFRLRSDRKRPIPAVWSRVAISCCACDCTIIRISERRSWTRPDRRQEGGFFCDCDQTENVLCTSWDSRYSLLQAVQRARRTTVVRFDLQMVMEW